MGLLNAKAVVHETLGLDTSTFEANVREPAAGFLEITSALFPLEAALLLGLAAGAERFTEPEDRSRMGAALAGASAGTLATLALSGAAAAAEAPSPALAAFVALVATTGALGARSATAGAESPLALYTSDAAELLPFTQNGDEESVGRRDPAALFYQSSVLTSLVVGASFLLSPVSPIALFEAEGAATHWLRQGLGVYVVFLLAPVQALLFRATRDGLLAQPTTKLLNVATGLCCGLLVCDGRAQVASGSAEFAALEPGSAFYGSVAAALGDPLAVGRSSTNTSAAFGVGLVVALFYVAQSLRKDAAE